MHIFSQLVFPHHSIQQLPLRSMLSLAERCKQTTYVLSYVKTVLAQCCAQANLSCLSAGCAAQALPCQEVYNFLLSWSIGRRSSCLSVKYHVNNPLAWVAASTISDLVLPGKTLAWLQWQACVLKAETCFVETKKCPISSEENVGTKLWKSCLSLFHMRRLWF